MTKKNEGLRAAIGHRITEARIAAGLTQADLGRELGVSHNTVHRWECADRTPDIDTLYEIGFAVGVEPRMLLPTILMTSAHRVARGKKAPNARLKKLDKEG